MKSDSTGTQRSATFGGGNSSSTAFLASRCAHALPAPSSRLRTDTCPYLSRTQDTKGNNGERGPLVLTNLRLIWCRQDRPSTNLSIGFNCIITLESRRAKSRLRGSTQSLRVLTKFNGTRFEFIFTSLVKSNPRLFGTIQAVRKSYESTKLYRNVKLRSAIVDDGKLMILPQEEVINTLSGVWNLSTDQGNLGTLITTNVRVVWFAHMAENFCVSAPWMQARPHVMCNSSLIRMRSGRAGGPAE